MIIFPNVRDKIHQVSMLNIDTRQNSNLSNSPTAATLKEIRRREEEISLKRDRLNNEDQSKFLIKYASG